MKNSKGGWFAFLIVIYTLMSSFVAKGNEFGVEYLLGQLSFQMGQRNLFQAEKTLSKINKVAPKNPVYLQENIRFLVESENFIQARIQLLKIKKIISMSEYDSLLQLLNIYQNSKSELSEARLLNKRQLYQKALVKYQQLFMSIEPHYSLALEYWDILTEVNPELEPTVLYKLERLSLQFPANTRIQLAYYKYALRAGKNKKQIYDSLYQLTYDSVWSFEAKRLWQYGLMNTVVNNNNQNYFLSYIERFPDDNYVLYHLKDGQDAIKQHTVLMRDPAYRAKLKLPIMLDNDSPLSEIALTLATAKTKYANEQDVILSEGRYLFRKNDYSGAKQAYERCIQLFVPPPQVCVSLLNTTNYWALISTAEQQIDLQQYSEAKKSLGQLYKFNDETNYHILVDANLQQALGNLVKAGELYFSLLAIEPLNSELLSAILEFKFNHFGKLNLDTWVSSLTLEQGNLIKEDYHSLLIARIREKADARLLEGNVKEAERLLKTALTIVQMHPWASYDLAKLYIQQGYTVKALNLYQPLANKVEVKYSYSLILANLNMYERALIVLNNVPLTSRTDSINKDIQEYEFELAMAQVDEAIQVNRLGLLVTAADKFKLNNVYIDRIQQQMLKYGFLQETELLASARLNLSLDPDSDPTKRIDILLQIAQVQMLTKQTDKAIETITQVYLAENRSVSHNIELSEMSLQLLENDKLTLELQPQLVELLKQQTTERPELVAVWQNNLRFAELTSDNNKIWQAITKLVELEPEQSYRFYQLFNVFEEHQDDLNISSSEFKSQYLIPFVQSFPFNPVGYDVAYRMFNRLPELNESAKSLLKKGYYTALMNDVGDEANFDIREVTDGNELLQKTNTSGLTQQQKQKIEQYYALLNSEDSVNSIEAGQGSWLVNRFQSALNERSLSHNRRLELGVRKYAKSGGQGTSEYDLAVLSLTYIEPMDNSWLGTGEWYVKIDPTIIKAGTLDVSDPASDRFGSIKLCDSRCDNLMLEQEQVGASIALGFENAYVTADIGTKPIGFNIFDWVGGVNYRVSTWDIGWSLGLSKRPVTSSLLSFSGSVDPYSTVTWGAASMYNAGVSLSYDQGTGWGVWALADAGIISGTQVKSNERTRAMGGVYWDWFNRDWLTASIGLNLFTWQYTDDLSEYTLGQSGYYSPQEYKSASIPLNFYGRLGDFTYQVDLSISRSESADDEMDYYPFHPDYQQTLERFSSDSFIGGRGTGKGYSATAMIEYKLTNHWTVGTNLTIQKSEFFSPNSLYFYIKYYFDSNLQLANRRPDPVSIYMDF